jgi:[ribosomal protein S18]-alanine N-acetyltransferase
MKRTGQHTQAAHEAVAAATAADLPELARLESMCGADPWTSRSIAADLASEHAFHWLLRAADNRIRSFVLARLISDELHIHKAGTHPDFRRQGLAKYLLGQVCSLAKERGARRAYLEVRAGNAAAIKLYASLGFTTDTVRKKYYPSDEDALLMSKIL